MTRILVDLTHTSHTRAHTGIQRLCRALREALRERADEVVPVCHDPYESTWRPLRRWEECNLAPPRGRVAGRRGSRWPLSAKIGGLLRRWLDAHTRNRPARALAGDWLIEPEIFSPTVGRAQPALFAGISGPRVALFHDAAALRLPELAPHKTVARYPVYLQELLRFDGIAAISDESRAVLVEYWRWLGVAHPPPVVGLPLGVDRPAPAPFGHTTAAEAVPVVLCVGSIEGRKNHLVLLEACERLWQRGLRFELQLIGLVHPETGRRALAGFEQHQVVLPSLNRTDAQHDGHGLRRGRMSERRRSGTVDAERETDEGRRVRDPEPAPVFDQHGPRFIGNRGDAVEAQQLLQIDGVTGHGLVRRQLREAKGGGIVKQRDAGARDSGEKRGLRAPDRWGENLGLDQPIPRQRPGRPISGVGIEPSPQEAADVRRQRPAAAAPSGHPATRGGKVALLPAPQRTPRGFIRIVAYRHDLVRPFAQRLAERPAQALDARVSAGVTGVWVRSTRIRVIAREAVSLKQSSPGHRARNRAGGRPAGSFPRPEERPSSVPVPYVRPS